MSEQNQNTPSTEEEKIGTADGPGSEAAAETTPEEPPKETPHAADSTPQPEVPKTLAALIEQLTKVVQDNRADNAEMKSQFAGLQSMVESIADKGRLQRYQVKQMEGKNIKRDYRVMKYRNKIVVGWGVMTQNLVFKTALGVWQEKLETELIYEDNSKEKVNYTIWQKERVLVPMQCEKEEVSDGGRFLTLVDKTGKTIRIDVRFVN